MAGYSRRFRGGPQGQPKMSAAEYEAMVRREVESDKPPGASEQRVLKSPVKPRPQTTRNS